MVKQIVRDIFFLGQPSKLATKADIQIGKDLQDTLQANRERCLVTPGILFPAIKAAVKAAAAKIPVPFNLFFLILFILLDISHLYIYIRFLCFLIIIFLLSAKYQFSFYVIQ